MFRKLIAWLTGGTPVILQDTWGKHYYSIAYTSPFGHQYARVYWVMRVGHTILKKDGTCYGDSSYIKGWIKG